MLVASVHGLEGHAKLRPLFQAHHFHVALLNPGGMNITRVELETRRITRQELAIGVVEARVRGARALAALPVHKELMEVPLALFDAGNFRGPEFGAILLPALPPLSSIP